MFCYFFGKILFGFIILKLKSHYYLLSNIHWLIKTGTTSLYNNHLGLSTQPHHHL